MDRLKDFSRKKRGAFLAIVILFSATEATVAGIATEDLTGQIRTTPQATMGALEVSSGITTSTPSPLAPGGLFITIQRTTT